MKRMRAVVAAIGLAGLVAGSASTTPSATAATRTEVAPAMPVSDWIALDGAAKQVPSVFTDINGIVHYAFNPAVLPGYVLALDSGETGPEGCEFSGSGSGSPTGKQMYTKITEVEFNPSTCTRKLAVASYPVASLPDVIKQTLSAAELLDLTKKPQSAQKTASTATIAAAGASYSGYLKANVEDPPGINVSSTKSSISWTATSSCVTSSTRSPWWGWFSGSGWSRTSGTVVSNWSTCSAADLNVAGTFKNDAFCPGSGNTTYTNHSKTHFQGQPGGRYYWAYSLAKSGGCSSLLSYDYDLSHP